MAAAARRNRGAGARAWPIGRALALSLAACAIASASAAAETALAVTIGFDGAVRPGVPAPLDVRIPPMPAGGPAELVIETPALTPQTGRATVSTVVPFQAVTGAAQRLRVPIVIQDVRHPVRVRLMLGGRGIAGADVPLDPARVAGRLIVLVSDLRAGLGVLRRVDERAVDAYITADGLPLRWQEYSGVDLLVLRDLDPARLGEAQRAALVTWIRLGGRLVVVARPGAALPAFLAPILPAHLGGPLTLTSPADLGARFGSAVPAAPIAATGLVPRPDAAVVRAGGVPVVAGAAAGAGYVTVWGIDPTVPPLADWEGRAGLWASALGTSAPAIVDATALADRMTLRAPIDRFSHVAAGLLIALYVGGLAVLRRRRPTPGGAAVAAVTAVVAVAVFATLAIGARARSTGLTQVAVLQQAPDAPVARALVVAAATVPYGGPVAVVGPPGAATAPVTMTGDLRINWRGDEATLAGVVRPDGPWVFQALFDVPLRTSARFGADAETLSLDLGAAGLRDAAVWSHGLVYPLGDLPAGRSTRVVPSSGWRRASDMVTDDRSTARFFRAPDTQAPGAIAQLPRPVLVGERSAAPPVFALAERPRGDTGVEDVVLVVPIGGPIPAAAAAAQP